MSLRDWLIVAGVVVLIVIVLDGIRRMRNRGKLRLEIDRQFEDLPEEDFNGELPNGGARISRAEYDSGIATAGFAESRGGDGAVPASREEDVDLLMDGSFRGVGEGADQWLQPQPDVVPQKSPEDDFPEALPEAFESPAEQPADRPAYRDRSIASAVDPEAEAFEQALAADISPAPQESNTESRGEVTEPDKIARNPLDDDFDGVISEVRVRSSDSTAGNPVAESAVSTFSAPEHQVESSSMPESPIEASATAESLPADRDHSAAEEISDTTTVEDQQAADRPAMTLIEEESLDLSQPVTVLMEQMKSRSAEQQVEERDAESKITLEPKPPVADIVREPVVADAVAGVSDHESVGATATAATDEQNDDGLHMRAAIDEPDIASVEAELSALGAVESAEAVKPTESSSSTRASRSRQKPAKKSTTRKKAEKPAKKSRMTRLREEIQTSFFDLDPDLAPEPVEDAEPKKKAKAKPDRKRSSKTTRKRKESAAEPPVPENTQPEPEEAPVLVISVAGRSAFEGGKLFRLVEACGMEFGDMHIFHRHEDGPGQGPVQFSMANAVKPGYFDPEIRDQLSTPAVTFFLEMSQPKELMNAFDCMLATAKCVADNLDGVLKDENRSVMRPQTIEHCRQQIRDFERRRLAKRP